MTIRLNITTQIADTISAMTGKVAPITPAIASASATTPTAPETPAASTSL